jgi:hypothetical protein
MRKIESCLQKGRIIISSQIKLLFVAQLIKHDRSAVIHTERSDRGIYHLLQVLTATAHADEELKKEADKLHPYALTIEEYLSFEASLMGACVEIKLLPEQIFTVLIKQVRIPDDHSQPIGFYCRLGVSATSIIEALKIAVASQYMLMDECK